MKKNYLIAICILAIASIPSAGLAAVSTITASANTITNNGTNAKGPASITVSVSPNVEMSLYSTTTAYAVRSANTITDTTNGLEYGTYHGTTGYAQQTKTTAAGTGPTAPTDASLAGLGSGWTWMGDSGN